MNIGERLAWELGKKGCTVLKFDPYHYRVNGQIDFWINEKGAPLSWHDHIVGDRGRKPEDQLVYFIVRRLSEHKDFEITEPEFVKRLTGIGWLETEARQEWQKRNANRAAKQ